MPAVSIVVPIYKVEKYLDRCVASLQAQTLRDIEIILVDDGSPDRCPEMCDEYAKKDSRIRVVHKKNGGLSSARNAGLTVAEGKCVGFIDSDDTAEPEMFEKLYQAVEREQVDFAMADYNRIPESGKSILKEQKIRGGRYTKQDIRNIIFPELIMAECIDYGPLLSVCPCLYRTEFLRRHKLTFDEQVRWSEDNIFSAIMGYYADSFYYLKGEGLYNYFNNPGTITTSHRPGAWKVYCTMNEHLHAFFDRVQDYDFSRQLKLHMMYYACVCLSQETSKDKKEALASMSEILHSKELTQAFADFAMPNVSWKLKLQLWLMRQKQTKLLYKMISRR